MSAHDVIREQLAIMYPQAVDDIAARIDTLIAAYADDKKSLPGDVTQADSFLITYGDSLKDGKRAPLQVLHDFLTSRVGDALSLVHILPFCPYTSDDGFSVVDYREIDPELGTWDDVEAIAGDYRMCYDAVVNHCSKSSPYMKGYASGDPEYADFFISLDPETDTSSVTRPRNLPLLHEYACQDGPRWLWTTFSEDQLDLNYENPNVLIEMLDVLLYYAKHGASMVRLDAITYFWKRLGTTCVHLPETHAFVKLTRALYDVVYPHMIVLTETNVPHEENISYFGNKGDEAQIVYNFTLSPMVVYSFANGDASKLSDWAKTITKISDRATFLNMTATHDGIGVRPTEGILTDAERQVLVERVEAHGGRVNFKANSDGSTSPYELNITYFDIINDPRKDEDVSLQVQRFMATQAIAMSFMGLPAIYIHSLLGSRNDIEGMESSGINRRINREKLMTDALFADLDDDTSRRSLVFNRYKELLSIRAQQAAFHPTCDQRVLDLDKRCFALRRLNESGEDIIALISVSEETCVVNLSAEGETMTDILSSSESIKTSNVSLSPYQVRWLRVS